MNQLNNLIYSSLVELNIQPILITIFGIAIFYLIYKTSIATLKRLKVDIFPNYPFDMFMPNSGKWSVGYFLTLVLFLILLAFFIIKGNFYPSGFA